MSIRDDVQAALKTAMKNRDQERLESLRMAKGALLVKEKEGGTALTDDEAIAVLRSEVRKRHQSVETFQEVGKPEAAEATRREIAVLEEFLPKQLSQAQLEEKVRAYLAANPDINHAGRLTGAMKKELGDLADGKMLNAVCQQVLG